MRRELRRAGRAGFTLIELLVVIAILALLAALIAAGIGRVRESAQGNVTTQTLTKLQKALENQWKVTCDNARDERRTYDTPTPNAQFKAVVAFCGGSEHGSVERAEALWMYMHIRRAMPHTFKEARTAVVLKDTDGKTVITSLAPSAAFAQVPDVPVATDTDAQSAALMYVILSQGGRGNSFALDDAMQGAQTSVTVAGTSYPAFKDGFGRPIAYRRFSNTSEMSQPPYVRAGLAITDPLDPVGRLKFWKQANGTAHPRRQKAIETVFALPGATPEILTPSTVQPTGWPTATDFDGSNRMATAISLGADPADGNDDAYGFRVLRQGAKGD